MEWSPLVHAPKVQQRRCEEAAPCGVQRVSGGVFSIHQQLPHGVYVLSFWHSGYSGEVIHLGPFPEC